MNIIFDCDNTCGIQGCDVDDGLALLYLLGSAKANLLGITCTYGNSDMETVYLNTKKMLQELGQSDLPLLKGCPSAADRQSEAVDFLLETVDRYAGRISILATGSLTNLYAAYEKDHEFFAKIKRISLMGGLIETLYLNGKTLDELNFSCDAKASYQVLTKGLNVGIATGNNCLSAFFSRANYEERLGRSSATVARYIYDKTAYWYDHHMDNYGLDGFYNWDVVAAAYMVDDYLFAANETMISPDLDSLQKGFLKGDGEKIPVFLPQILDTQIFEQHVYDTYLQVQL